MKTRKLFAILTAALSLTTISAQENIIYGGIGLPQGKFGGDDTKEVFLSNGGKEGGAALGLNVGFKSLQSISPAFSWFISGDIFYNGLHSDIKDDIEDGWEDVEKLPAYINVPVMGGVNFSIAELGTGFSLWAEAGLGLNFRYITDYSVSEKSTDTYMGTTYTLHEELNISFDSKFLVAYQIGAGLKINDQFTVGLHYYNLGSDKVKMDYKYELDPDYYDESFKDDGKSSKKLSTSLVAVRVGFVF